MQSRPNPFLAFRRDPASSSEEEGATVVTKTYEPRDKLAVILLSDGTTKNPDHYEQGPSCFIVAKRFDPVASLDLQIPNRFLDGQTIKPYEVPKVEPQKPKKKPAAMKKPAATKLIESASEDEAVVHEEAESEHVPEAAEDAAE